MSGRGGELADRSERMGRCECSKRRQRRVAGQIDGKSYGIQYVSRE